MSVKNFIPEVWAAQIERELSPKRVFVEDCNREFEGDLKDFGDTVHILGAGSPTVYDITPESLRQKIKDPEFLEDSSVDLKVQHGCYYNYQIPDIDLAMAKPDSLKSVFQEETTEKIANKHDKYIAGFAVNKSAVPLFETPEIVTVDNVLDIIDRAVEKLFENNVSDSTPISLTISPKFFTLFKKAYLKGDTNNHELMKNGKVAMYGGATIKRSNNVYRENGVDYAMMRTKRAIAFVDAFVRTEAYRPEGYFSDAVKGYSVYEGKLVRPKEMFTLNVKYQ